MLRLPTVWLVSAGVAARETSAQGAASCLTWYLVMLVSCGLSQVSVASASPGTADRPVGFAGGPPCGVALTAAEGGLVPVSFSATTAKV